MNFDIQKYSKELPIIRETADQIIKDFQFFDIVINFSGNGESAYDELFQQIKPRVEELIQTRFERFLSLMYKIDVGDKLVQEALQLPDSNRAGDAITDYIIQRELLKVITRNYFRRKRLEESEESF